MLLLSSVLLVALLIYLFELGNYIYIYLRALLPILAVCKISEAAATVSVMSKSDMLHMIYG